MDATDSLETLLAIRETQKTVCNESSKFRPGLDRCAGTRVQANEKQRVWCCVNLKASCCDFMDLGITALDDLQRHLLGYIHCTTHYSYTFIRYNS